MRREQLKSPPEDAHVEGEAAPGLEGPAVPETTAAEAVPSRRTPSNLTLRLLTAGVLIPPVVYACWAGGLLYVAIVIGIVCLAAHEFYNFISAKGATPNRWLGIGGAALLPLVAYVGDPFYATSLMTVVLLTVMILQLGQHEIREAIISVSATFFGVVYVGWMLAHAVSVRFIHADLVRRYGEVAAVSIDPEVGFFYMLLCLCAAVLCDAGAYFAGRAYGRRPLMPTISPNKTVEGAIGGIVAGTLGALIAKLFFDHVWPGHLSRDLSLTACLLFGAALAAVSILGDLAESLLKRDANLKDAGSLLPGVGGVLDRIDSALLAIPVTYYLLLAYYYTRLGW